MATAISEVPRCPFPILPTLEIDQPSAAARSRALQPARSRTRRSSVPSWRLRVVVCRSFMAINVGRPCVRTGSRQRNFTRLGMPMTVGRRTMTRMHHMERAEWLEFVLHGTRTGKLATTRKDGGPHVAPIWFLVDSTDDGDHLVFTTGADTVKGRALRRDPRLALCVDTEAPPYSFVQVQAEAVISEDLDDMLDWATRLAARYMGAEKAEAYGRRNAVPGELLVRARATKVIALAEIAD